MADWHRYGDTCEAAYEHLHGLHEDRIRQVDALYAQNQEMLAALKAAQEHVGLVRIQNGFSIEPIREQVAAAIAKAEGRP